MPQKTTFIKLDRSILSWEWFTNPKTYLVFTYLLLTANTQERGFEGRTVKRGQKATSYSAIADALNLTYKEVRTAIDHLKTADSIKTEQIGNYLLITVSNYDYYQGEYTECSLPYGRPRADRGQSAGNPSANEGQQYNNNYNKYNKNKNNNYARTFDDKLDVEDYFATALQRTRNRAKDTAVGS